MRLIIIGLGNVGANFVKLLKDRQADLTREHHLDMAVVGVADNGGYAFCDKGLNPETIISVKQKYGTVASYPNYGAPKASITKAIEDVKADIVVDMTPTNIVNGEPGISNIKSALLSGKHVVTTNKGPLALAYKELVNLATEKHLLFKFSGTVGGATPVIDFAQKCLIGNPVTKIEGILNGTTNFILTKMFEERIQMIEALKEAQKLGYAEEDPSYDIDAIDPACKLVILANAILGKKARLQDVEREGITKVTLDDILEASKQGLSVKLICTASNELLQVKPKPIKKDDPLCVDGVLNAVSFYTKLGGTFTLIGRGAGGMEAASSALRDIINIGLTTREGH
jgi:homoserine dehydrogenase